MKISLKIIALVVMMSSGGALADAVRVLGPNNVAPELRWQVVNDTVMGGRSSSQLKRVGEALHFSGRLNTNGGGFASLRSDRMNLDLAAATSVRLTVKGDGRTYSIRLYAAGQRVSYQHAFRTVADAWQTVELKIPDFYASWRGRRMDQGPLAAADIAGIGLILADGTDGAFEIEVSSIEFDVQVATVSSDLLQT
jgi:hypothetical protein